MKSQFQYVFMSLLLKWKQLVLIEPHMFSCVMNHVLNVLLSYFLVLLLFMSMITITLLESYSESFYILLVLHLLLNLFVCCVLCSAWMLHLLQFDCFSENVFSAESLSACIIMHLLIPLLPDYWILNIFYNSLESYSVLSWSFVFFWGGADGILMNSTVLMWYLSSFNPDINCQAGAFEMAIIVILWRKGRPLSILTYSGSQVWGLNLI